jgi:hypothetical protein
MKKEVGLWIDHNKAVIVSIENEVEVIREIQSNMEKHVRFSGATHSKNSANTKEPTAEDMRDRQFNNHLGVYYDGVVSLIGAADAVLVFGPGEAKVEMTKRLKKAGLGDKTVAVEAVDKMTTRQIAAKVRDHFLR